MAINAAQDIARFVMDGDGNIVEWDSGAESIFGWSRDDVIGKRLSTLIIPERFRAVHEAGLQRYKATGKGAFVGRTIEISTLHKSGRELPVAITISMENGAAGYRFPTVARLIDAEEPK